MYAAGLGYNIESRWYACCSLVDVRGRHVRSLSNVTSIYFFLRFVKAYLCYRIVTMEVHGKDAYII